MSDAFSQLTQQYHSGEWKSLSANCFIVQPLSDESAVAAKRIKVAQSLTDSYFLKREALWLQRLSKLISPNWTHKCFAINKVANFTVLETDYIAGEALSDFIRKNEQLSISDLEKLIEEMGRILAQLRHMRIVHCDLKPANFLITNEGQEKRLKVIDFANARRVGDPLIERGFMQYSPSYHENIENVIADSKLDCFSASVCAAQLCSLYVGKLCSFKEQPPYDYLDNLKSCAHTLPIPATELDRLNRLLKEVFDWQKTLG